MQAATYTPDEPPISRQHLVLVVPLPGVGDFLCDVGFGGGSPGKPLLLLDGRVSDAFGEVFKTTAGAANEDTWAVWVWHGEWRRLFSFDHMSESLPHVHAADFIMCSHYVQHAAGTLFMTCRFASKPVEAGGRATLLNGELRIRSAEKEGQPSPPMAVSRLTSAAEFQTVLRDTFKIRVTAEEAAVLWAAEQALPCVNRPTPRPAPPRVADVVLHYLPLRSKGTHIRMLLTAAGILFTDKLYSLTSGEWETTKASGRFPFDCLPVLSFVTVADGKAHEIPEAPAIARLVAAWGGIAADGDPIEAARRDAAYSAVVGLNPVDPIFNGAELNGVFYWRWHSMFVSHPISCPGFHTDAAANAAVLDTVVSHLAKIEAGCLGDRPFLGGATPCAADFLLAALSENIEALRPGAFASRDKLRAWLGRARSLPAVKLVLEKEAARAGAPATAA